jgi:anti-sigma B factor antagonist
MAFLPIKIKMEFTYTISNTDNIVVVALQGELIEKHQAQSLLDELEIQIGGGKNKIIFDLGDLKYLNSVGLNVLISLLTKCRTGGGEVLVSNLSKKVKDLFVITKLNSVFTVTENLGEAREYFNNQSN